MKKDKGVYWREDCSCYWIRYRVRGTAVRESSESRNKKDAIKLREQRLGEKAADRAGGKKFVFPKDRKVKMAELFENLREHLEAEGSLDMPRLSALNHAKDAFGNMRAEEVTLVELDRYKNEKKYKYDENGNKLGGWSNGYIRHIRRLTTQAMSMGVEAGIISCPVPKLKRKKNEVLESEVEQAILSNVEVKSIEKWFRDNGEPDWADFTRVAFLTFWRPDELSTLTWAGVTLQRGIVTKIALRADQDKERQIGRRVCPPPGGELEKLLRGRLAIAPKILSANGEVIPDPDALVFTRISHRGRHRIAMRAWSGKYWKRALYGAGIVPKGKPLVRNGSRLKFYALRHSGASDALVERNASLPTVKDIGGWAKKSKVLEGVYLHVEDENQRRAFEKMDESRAKDALLPTVADGDKENNTLQ